MMQRFIRALLVFTALTLSATARAHKASDSYLSLKVEGVTVTGQWDIALRDLDLVLELDRNADSVIDWGEVRSRHAEIAASSSSSPSGISWCRASSHCRQHTTLLRSWCYRRRRLWL